jgi:hypothetical protein
MPANKKKAPEGDIAPLIDPLRGNVAAIARRLGVSRRTVKRRIDANPELKEALHDAREGMLDDAESVLYAKCLAGDTRAIIFFLRTQAKDRGYSLRTEPVKKASDPLGPIDPKVKHKWDALVASLCEERSGPEP